MKDIAVEKCYETFTENSQENIRDKKQYFVIS